MGVVGGGQKISVASYGWLNHGRFVRMGVTTVGIFLVFFTLYFIVSLRLSKTSAFTEFDILFEMDTPRVIKDMTRPEATHNRTKVHPIYVLLMNPIGKPLSGLVSSELMRRVALNFFWAGRIPRLYVFELPSAALRDASARCLSAYRKAVLPVGNS